VVLSVLVVASACKSTYERIRTSGDVELIYRKSMEYFDEGEYLKAQGLMEIILPYYRGRKGAEELFYKFAYTYFYTQEYILAATYFENFAKTFLNSPYREEADYMAAYCYYLLAPDYKLDQKYTYKAMEYLQLFANRYPTSERLDDVNKLLDELRFKLETKAKYNAELYYKMGRYKAAIRSFEDMLIQYPDTRYAEEVRYLLVKSYYLWAKNSIPSKQKERYTAAIREAEHFLKRYPRSAYRKEVRQIIRQSRKHIKIV